MRLKIKGAVLISQGTEVTIVTEYVSWGLYQSSSSLKWNDVSCELPSKQTELENSCMKLDMWQHIQMYQFSNLPVCWNSFEFITQYSSNYAKIWLYWSKLWTCTSYFVWKGITVRGVLLALVFISTGNCCDSCVHVHFFQFCMYLEGRFSRRLCWFEDRWRVSGNVMIFINKYIDIYNG